MRAVLRLQLLHVLLRAADFFVEPGHRHQHVGVFGLVLEQIVECALGGGGLPGLEQYGRLHDVRADARRIVADPSLEHVESIVRLPAIDVPVKERQVRLFAGRLIVGQFPQDLVGAIGVTQSLKRRRVRQPQVRPDAAQVLRFGELLARFGGLVIVQQRIAAQLRGQGFIALMLDR